MRAIEERDVVLGQPLAQGIVDAEGKLLLERGHIVRSAGTRQALLDRGFIEEAEPTDVAAPAQPDSAPLATSMLVQRSIFEGMRAVLDALIEVQQRLLRADPAGLAALQHLNGLLGAYAERDVDAAMAAMQLSDPEDGLAARPIHAALLLRVLAQAADSTRGEIDSLAGAALTHDIALLPQNAGTRNADGAQPRAELDNHTQRAVELLRGAGLQDPVWLDAVLHHHERLDGAGYPDQLSAAQIGPGTRMVTIVDTYCAMIRPRAYSGAVQSRDALRSLFMERGRAVDEALTGLFVKQVGLYPPGGLVRLASNEVALVLRRGANTTQPQVRRLLKPDSSADPERSKRDTADPRFAVVESLPQDSYRALLRGVERLWD